MAWFTLGVALMAAPPATAPAYRVGPGDLLEISVAARPEGSRLVTVQTTGSIFLPSAGDVHVGGLTLDEIRLKLSEPGFRVSIKEYRSQFVWVEGEVVHGGRRPLRGSTRLVDVLVAAGGLTEAASGEVVVERRDGRFADGTAVKSFFLSGVKAPDELSALSTLLVNRDLVSARKVRYVQVSGAVTRPGRYPLRRGTVAEALAAAGGVTNTAGRRATVSRIDPRTGDPEVLELELERDTDASLLADDQLTVPKR
jgi:polysaccharide biosynthesis/export protein